MSADDWVCDLPHFAVPDYVSIQDEVDPNLHLFAKVKNIRLAPGVTKKIIEHGIPGLEMKSFYRPKAKKIAWFLSAAKMLKECGLGPGGGGKTCIWYEYLSLTPVRPDWVKTATVMVGACLHQTHSYLT